MKRILVGLLAVIMAVVFVGCNETTKTETETEEKSKITQKVHYSDDQVLFAAQDRCDVEGDSYKMYFYNYKGELLDSSEYIGYYAENGLAPAMDQNTEKWGFVDKDGVFQIAPKYRYAAPFSKDGIALVSIVVEEDGEEDYKYGYINSKGKEIIPCIYDSATSFYDCGYALAFVYESVTDENGFTNSTLSKQYIINERGKELIEIDLIAEQRVITDVYEEYFVCLTKEGVMSIYDYSNKKITETKVEEPDENDTQFIYYLRDKDALYKNTCKSIEGGETYFYTVLKSERFDGKRFVEVKKDYKITSKQVATTQSGLGYGVIENNKTVIPFEYDEICEYGDYFVAIKYTGNPELDQTFDIYDKDYNKTAENIEYMFYNTHEIYGTNGKFSQMPNGFFQIAVEHEDYGGVWGIIDYTGKIIVEPVFDSGIKLYSYESMGGFITIYNLFSFFNDSPVSAGLL